jgi:hypothetical protein
VYVLWVNEAVTLLNFTDVAVKQVLLAATAAPTTPEVGAMLGVPTTKAGPAMCMPPLAYTVITPLVAPAGTEVIIKPSLQLWIVA